MEIVTLAQRFSVLSAAIVIRNLRGRFIRDEKFVAFPNTEILFKENSGKDEPERIDANLTEKPESQVEIPSMRFFSGEKWDLVGYIDRFEHIAYIVLILFLIVVLLFSVIELAMLLFRSYTNEFPYHLKSHEIIDIFGFFLLILVGIELLGTIKAYLNDRIIRVEIVLLLALIAVSRELILIDRLTAVSQLIGYGVLIIALGFGYYLIKCARTSRPLFHRSRPEE